MKSSLILGTVTALVSFAPAAAAKSPAEIEQMAKAVSVAYNQAISRDPKDADAYNNRGVLKATKLNDPKGAIGDLRTAARIYRVQGQTQSLQRVNRVLNSLGATEIPSTVSSFPVPTRVALIPKTT
jgi:hypothetical protein